MASWNLSQKKVGPLSDISLADIEGRHVPQCVTASKGPNKALYPLVVYNKQHPYGFPPMLIITAQSDEAKLFPCENFLDVWKAQNIS